MIKTNIYNQKAESVGELELSSKIFGVKSNEALIHQAYVAQISNERQVLAHTLGRAEVRGGGKKPWKQKGTGRARAGSSRSPIWIGGGVVFGPTKNRNFKKDINKKMKQKAMFMVLSDKVAGGQLVVLDKIELADFKTKEMNQVIKNVETKVLPKLEGKTKRSVLLVNGGKDEKVKFSTRNLAGVEVINLENINIYDLLNKKNIILTKEAVEKIQDTYKK